MTFVLLHGSTGPPQDTSRGQVSRGAQKEPSLPLLLRANPRQGARPQRALITARPHQSLQASGLPTDNGRQQVKEPGSLGGKSGPELPGHHHSFSLTSPSAADLSPSKGSTEKYSVWRSPARQRRGSGPLLPLGHSDGSGQLGLSLAVPWFQSEWFSSRAPHEILKTISNQIHCFTQIG